MFNRMFTLMKQKFAFNMLEVTISLITIACIASAFVPVITKKVTHSSLAIRQTTEAITDCTEITVDGVKLDSDCKVCYPEKCLICNKTCKFNQAKIIKTCQCENCSERPAVSGAEGKCNRCTDLAQGGKNCDRCEAGYYLPTGGSDKYKCKKCPAGHACPEPSTCPNPCREYQWSSAGSPVCDLPCPAGKYCHTVNESFDGCNRKHKQEDCHCGNYCTKGDVMKQCAEGYYQNKTGQTSCNYCTCGYWGEKGRCSDCNVKCQAGYSCNNGKKDACPTGHYCPEGSCAPIQTTCGHYQDETTKSTQKDCPTGKYQDERKTTSCKTTPAGRYRNADKCGVTCCPNGKWSNQGADSVSSCTTALCGAGYWCKNCDRKKCTKGHYCPEGSSQEINCPKGYKCPDDGMSTPTPCGKGYYQDTAGKTSCNDCTKGHYCPTTTTVNPVDCPKGHKCPDTKMSTPTACDKGYYQASTAQTTCTACEKGKYQDETGKDSCKCCAAGKVNPNTAQTSCTTNCAAGTYSTGCASVCTCCDAGYWSPAGTIKKDDCKKCDAGTYCPGGTNCTNAKCNCGYYSTAGSSSCTACGGGAFSAAGAGSCTACPGGFACTSCAKGSQCSAGEYSPSNDRSCHKCDKGSYSGAGASSCTPCPAGKYQDTTGQSGCKNCPAGTWSDAGATAASSCTKPKCGDGYACKDGVRTQCSAGYYAAAGASTCTACADGQTSAAGAKSCTCCGNGKWSTNHTSCSDCPKGHKCEASGCKKTQCSAGTYAAAGASTCTACADGQTSAAGASTCTCCGNGKWSTNHTSCSDCPKGHKCEASGCKKTQCPAGTYAAAGASTCTICGTGTYSKAGAGACTDCEAGKFQDKQGQSSCKNCTCGKWGSTGRVSDCTDKCPAGYYCKDGAKTACTGLIAGQCSCKNCKDFHAQCTKCSTTECQECSSGSTACDKWHLLDRTKNVAGKACIKNWCTASCTLGFFTEVDDFCITNHNMGDGAYRHFENQWFDGGVQHLSPSIGTSANVPKFASDVTDPYEMVHPNYETSPFTGYTWGGDEPWSWMRSTAGKPFYWLGFYAQVLPDYDLYQGGPGGWNDTAQNYWSTPHSSPAYFGGGIWYGGPRAYDHMRVKNPLSYINAQVYPAGNLIYDKENLRKLYPYLRNVEYDRQACLSTEDMYKYGGGAYWNYKGPNCCWRGPSDSIDRLGVTGYGSSGYQSTIYAKESIWKHAFNGKLGYEEDTYPGNDRTACNWYAASATCDHYNPNTYFLNKTDSWAKDDFDKNWSLPTIAQIPYIKDYRREIQLCTEDDGKAYSGNSDTRICARRTCLGSNTDDANGIEYSNLCNLNWVWLKDKNSAGNPYAMIVENGWGSHYAPVLKSAGMSVRCVHSLR